MVVDRLETEGVRLAAVPDTTARLSQIWKLGGFPLSNLDPKIMMTGEDCMDAFSSPGTSC
jgi:hypothetical protein